MLAGGASFRCSVKRGSERSDYFVQGSTALCPTSGPNDGSWAEDWARYPSSTLLPFYFGVSLLKLNSRTKGTLIINGLLGNLVGASSRITVYAKLNSCASLLHDLLDSTLRLSLLGCF